MVGYRLISRSRTIDGATKAMSIQVVELHRRPARRGRTRPDPAGPTPFFARLSFSLTVATDKVASTPRQSDFIADSMPDCSVVRAALAVVRPPRMAWVKLFMIWVPSTVVTPRKRPSPPGAPHVWEIGCHSLMILTLLALDWNCEVEVIDLSGGRSGMTPAVQSFFMFW